MPTTRRRSGLGGNLPLTLQQEDAGFTILVRPGGQRYRDTGRCAANAVL